MVESVDSSVGRSPEWHRGDSLVIGIGSHLNITIILDLVAALFGLVEK